MASTPPFTLKWGIMATGWIAEMLVKDILTDPATRDVHDVRHEIVAVASSSSKDRAAEFLTKVECPGSPKTYGSYAALVADPNVDIIYVATPHSHHFQNTMLALEAGKHVLCEKAFTVNAAQARKLVEVARAKKLFLMEAVWTRYFPLSIKVRELVQSGAIGKVQRVVADLSVNKDKPDGSLDFPNTHRMLDPNLAGGALLDLGIYSLTWLFQILYHLQPEKGSSKESPQVLSTSQKYPATGVDESTSMILNFPRHNTVGIALTSLRLGSDVDGHFRGGAAIRIQGTQGEIQVVGPAYKPYRYRVIKREGGGVIEIVDCPFPKDEGRKGWGHGLYWEADECARCLRDGKLESETLPLDESIIMMEVMESALRQGGVEYPELITTDIYDPQSPLNTGMK